VHATDLPYTLVRLKRQVCSSKVHLRHTYSSEIPIKLPHKKLLLIPAGHGSSMGPGAQGSDNRATLPQPS
jgi:hypothetical protein